MHQDYNLFGNSAQLLLLREIGYCLLNCMIYATTTKLDQRSSISFLDTDF